MLPSTWAETPSSSQPVGDTTRINVYVDNNLVFSEINLLDEKVGSAWDDLRLPIPLPAGATHAACWLHGDVKPENVLLGDDGSVVIIDYGVAHFRETDDGTAAEMTNAVIGTFPYMSPEQKRGADDVDLGLLRGERHTRGLGVEAQLHAPLELCAVPLLHPAGPDATGGPVLRDLLEEVDVGVEEERQPGREVVDVEAGRERRLHVRDAIGEREALVAGSTRHTFASLEAKANQVANFLLSRGVTPGQHIGLHMVNSAEFIEILNAIRARDESSARGHMRNHLERSRDQRIRMFASRSPAHNILSALG